MPQQSTILTLIKGDKNSPETDYRDALPENMYAVMRPMFGSAGYMIEEPGLTLFGLGLDVSRGGIWNENQQNHFRVQGSRFVEVDEDGIVTPLGPLNGSTPVSLPYSFNTQGIVSNFRFFLYDITNGYREVTDPDLGDPIDCVWVDGYYFFTDGDFIYHTDIDDESAIDPLKFSTAQFSPDPTLGVGLTQDNKVIVFGRYTTEYFVNDASENFAFSRVASRAVKVGIVGTHCKVEVKDNWYLLGGRKEEAVGFYRLGIGNATKVSTRTIDKIIAEYSESDLANVVVETHEDEASTHIIVHLPDYVLKFNETVASAVGIDAAWSIIKTGTGSTPWRGYFGVFDARLGQWIYGDKQNGNLGILDETTNLQYGEHSEWKLFTPYTYIETASIDELEIQTIPGFNTTYDATVFLSLTYDGVVYGQEKRVQYGDPNQYGKRFIARRLGNVNRWFAFRMRGVSDSRMVFSSMAIKYG